MVRAISPDPSDGSGAPDPFPGVAVVAVEVQGASAATAYSLLAPLGLDVATAMKVAQALGYDDVLNTLRYADLVAQAYYAKAQHGTALPAAIADWVTSWQAGRVAVEGDAGDILLDLS